MLQLPAGLLIACTTCLSDKQADRLGWSWQIMREELFSLFKKVVSSVISYIFFFQNRYTWSYLTNYNGNLNTDVFLMNTFPYIEQIKTKLDLCWLPVIYMLLLNCLTSTLPSSGFWNGKVILLLSSFRQIFPPLVSFMNPFLSLCSVTYKQGLLCGFVGTFISLSPLLLALS